MTEGIAKRGRGRPRKHPDGVGPTAKDRFRASIDNLERAGGARKIFRLSPEAVSSLHHIRMAKNEPNDTAIINRLLIQESDRLKK